MPLLQVNQLKKALSESGVKKIEDVKQLLELEGLGPSELISELGTCIRGADSTAMKLRGIDTALKLNGLLKNDDVVNIPTVNIIIHDSEYAAGVNPILIPRI